MPLSDLEQLERDRDHWKARAEKAEADLKETNTALAKEALFVDDLRTLCRSGRTDRILERLRAAGEGGA